MNKQDVIKTAEAAGVSVHEITCGIFDQYQAYAIEPVSESARKYRDGMYHVTCNTSSSELKSGVGLMCERLGIKTPTFNGRAKA